jgi:predicted dehydrogenase
MTSVKQLLLLVGVGKIGAAHLEVILQQMQDGLYKGYKLGIVSRRSAIREGDLSSLPEVMNLGIRIRRRIEPELLEHIVFYSSVEEALADEEHDVDVAIVTRDTNEHSALVQQLRAESVHVLVEKPLCTEQNSALAAVREHGKKARLGVAHELYFFSQFRGLVETVASGTFGPKQRALGRFQYGHMSRMVALSDPSIGHPSRKGKCRSAFFDLFVHDGHLAMLMFGRPRAITVLDYRTHEDDSEFLSWAKVQLEWGNASTIEIAVGTFKDDSIGFAHDFEMVFQMAAISMDGDGVSIHAGEDQYSMELPATYIGGAIEPIAAEQDLFLDQISGKRTDLSVLDSKLALDAVVLADLAEKIALAGNINQSTQIDWLETE